MEHESTWIILFPCRTVWPRGVRLNEHDAKINGCRGAPYLGTTRNYINYHIFRARLHWGREPSNMGIFTGICFAKYYRVPQNTIGLKHVQSSSWTKAIRRGADIAIVLGLALRRQSCSPSPPAKHPRAIDFRSAFGMFQPTINQLNPSWLVVSRWFKMIQDVSHIFFGLWRVGHPNNPPISSLIFQSEDSAAELSKSIVACQGRLSSARPGAMGTTAMGWWCYGCYGGHPVGDENSHGNWQKIGAKSQ